MSFAEVVSPMTVLVMSTREISRIDVLERVIERRLSCAQAAHSLGIGRRQVHRILKAYKSDGPAGLVSKKRGRRSNRSYSPGFKEYALSIVRQRYHDFGPTLAAEKLAESHEIFLSKETLRQWMIEAGLWSTRRERARQVHQPRYRRDCLGELIQIDGSEHWWFETRGPKCTLLVYIDDATSRLMHLEFVKSESTFDYLRATRTYIESHGKPVAFYSDKHGIFRVNARNATGGDGMTQFGRALHELNIDIICANTSQAKGRVERAHKTLQDRLVKELRLAGVSDIDAANGFLPAFTEAYNSRFARPPRSDKNVHRPVAGHENMDSSFCWQEDRTVSQNLTFQYDRMMFLLEPNEITTALKRKRITVYDHPDGRLEVRHKGVELPFKIFDKVRQVDQGAIVDNKRLGAVLEVIQEQQRETAVRRSRSAPQRRGQRNSRFAVVEERA